MVVYSQQHMEEALKKGLQDPIDLALFFVMYGADIISDIPITPDYVDILFRFPNAGTGEKHLARLEDAGLIKKAQVYGHTGYQASSMTRQIMNCDKNKILHGILVEKVTE